jgi:hypothetical protein
LFCFFPITPLFRAVKNKQALLIHGKKWESCKDLVMSSGNDTGENEVEKAAGREAGHAESRGDAGDCG